MAGRRKRRRIAKTTRNAPTGPLAKAAAPSSPLITGFFRAQPVSHPLAPPVRDPPPAQPTDPTDEGTRVRRALLQTFATNSEWLGAVGTAGIFAKGRVSAGVRPFRERDLFADLDPADPAAPGQPHSQPLSHPSSPGGLGRPPGLPSGGLGPLPARQHPCGTHLPQLRGSQQSQPPAPGPAPGPACGAVPHTPPTAVPASPPSPRMLRQRQRAAALLRCLEQGRAEPEGGSCPSESASQRGDPVQEWLRQARAQLHRMAADAAVSHPNSAWAEVSQTCGRVLLALDETLRHCDLEAHLATETDRLTRRVLAAAPCLANRTGRSAPCTLGAPEDDSQVDGGMPDWLFGPALGDGRPPHPALFGGGLPRRSFERPCGLSGRELDLLHDSPLPF